MKDSQYWTYLLSKLKERNDYNILMYGDSFIEITYKYNMIDSISFRDMSTHEIIINNKK